MAGACTSQKTTWWLKLPAGTPQMSWWPDDLAGVQCKASLCTGDKGSLAWCALCTPHCVAQMCTRCAQSLSSRWSRSSSLGSAYVVSSSSTCPSARSQMSLAVSAWGTGPRAQPRLRRSRVGRDVKALLVLLHHSFVVLPPALRMRPLLVHHGPVEGGARVQAHDLRKAARSLVSSLPHALSSSELGGGRTSLQFSRVAPSLASFLAKEPMPAGLDGCLARCLAWISSQGTGAGTKGCCAGGCRRRRRPSLGCMERAAAGPDSCTCPRGAEPGLERGPAGLALALALRLLGCWLALAWRKPSARVRSGCSELEPAGPPASGGRWLDWRGASLNSACCTGPSASK